MLASQGVTALTGNWLNLPLFFAQQPEPDLEFTEEDLDDHTSPIPPPMRAPKRSGKKPLLWILLLLVLGVAGYAAYDPDGVMLLLEPYLGGDGEQAQQAAPMPPGPRPNAGETPTTAPPPPAATTTPAPAGSASSPVPAKPQPPAAAVPAPAPAPTPAPAGKPMAPVTPVAGPLFGEGQRVVIVADPARPGAPIPLFNNAAGTKTATTVSPSTTLTVMDGEWAKSGWVYAVRTDDGRKGWISERSLKPKR